MWHSHFNALHFVELVIGVSWASCLGGENLEENECRWVINEFIRWLRVPARLLSAVLVIPKVTIECSLMPFLQPKRDNARHPSIREKFTTRRLSILQWEDVTQSRRYELLTRPDYFKDAASSAVATLHLRRVFFGQVAIDWTEHVLFSISNTGSGPTTTNFSTNFTWSLKGQHRRIVNNE